MTKHQVIAASDQNCTVIPLGWPVAPWLYWLWREKRGEYHALVDAWRAEYRKAGNAA